MTKIILSCLAMLFSLSTQNYCQNIFDFHTHEGFQSTEEQIQFNGYDFFKRNNISAFCYSLPVNKSETNNLFSRLESEIEQINIIAAKNPNLSILNKDNITTHLDSNLIYCSFSVEYFHGMFSKNINNIPKLKELGIRHITIVDDKYDNLFENKGPTEFGKKVIEQLNTNDILIDISHLSENQRIEVIKHSSKPVIYSHTNSREITNLNYNISSTELNLLKKNGGYVFISFNELGLFTEQSDSNNGIDMLAAHITSLVKELGVDRVGIGSDYQAGGRYIPYDLTDKNVARYLYQRLQSHGLSKEDIEKVFNKNTISLLCYQELTNY